jgi:glycosyltransferase involved in cell wall biosynthesis
MIQRPVSMVICTQNRAKRLPMVIECLRRQNYPADLCEIVIIDNHSTDETKLVIEQFASQPGIPIRYVYEPRQGITFARNRGTAEAHFPYLAYLDDDCSVDAGWLGNLMAGFDRSDHIIAVFGQVINDWSGQVKPRWISPEIEIWLGNNTFLGGQARILPNTRGVRECNMAMNKEILKKCGGFLGMEQFGSQHMSAGELMHFIWQARNQGGQIIYIPEAEARHFVTPRSRTWMIRRAFWSGISAGIANSLVYRRSFWEQIPQSILDLAAAAVLLLYAVVNIVTLRESRVILFLMRSTRRFSLFLSEMHVVGDWQRIRAWVAEHD